jgi:hypothetical protein
MIDERDQKTQYFSSSLLFDREKRLEILIDGSPLRSEDASLTKIVKV